MPYTKQTWADNDNTKPLSASRMNYIEEGIQTAQETAEAAGSPTGYWRTEIVRGQSQTPTSNTPKGSEINDKLATLTGLGGGTLIIEGGGLYIEESLNKPSNVIIEGRFGQGASSASSGGRWPELFWGGPDGDSFVVMETIGDRHSYGVIRQLVFRCFNSPSTRFGHGLDWADRTDLGTTIEQVAIQHGQGYATYHGGGALNYHAGPKFRIDGMAGAYWKVVGSDIYTMDGFTVDNAGIPGGHPLGHTLYIDADYAAIPNNYHAYCSISRCRLEVNATIGAATTEGVIMFAGELTVSQKVMLHLNLGPNLTVAVAGGAGSPTGLLVKPWSDFVDVNLYGPIKLTNSSGVPIIGIPSWRQYAQSSEDVNLSTMHIAPYSRVHQGSPGSERMDALRVVGVSRLEEIFIGDKEAAMWIIAEAPSNNITNWPYPKTIRQGQMILDASDVASGAGTQNIYRVLNTGTVGALASPINVTSNGTATLTIVSGDATQLFYGAQVAVAGVAGNFRIIGWTETTITVHSNVSAQTNVSLTFAAPTYETATLAFA